MVDALSNSSALPPDDRAALLTATGRRDLVDALHWMAEGRPLVGGADLSGMLTPLVAAVDAGVRGSEPALRAAVRAALRSTLDTSADLGTGRHGRMSITERRRSATLLPA